MRFLSLFALTFLTLFLTGCGSDEGFTRELPPSALLRVVNTIQDSPILTAEFQAQRIGSVNFGDASQLTEVLPTVPRNFRVLYIEDNEVRELLSREITIPIDNAATVFLTGTMAAPSAIVVNEAPKDLTDVDTTLVRGVHAAAGISGNVTFTLSRAGDDDVVQQVAFGSVGADIRVPAADNYTLTVTQGSETLVESRQFSLGGQSLHTLTLLDRNGPAGVNARVINVDLGSTVAIFDRNPSALRMVNMVPDRTRLDFYIDDELVAEDLLFTDVSDYEIYDFATVTVTATVADDPENVVAETEHSLFGGAFQTAFAVGLDATTAVIVEGDDRREIAGRARLDVTHASFSSGTVDVYLLAPGNSVNDFAPSLNSVSYQESLGIQVDGGSYNLFLTVLGTKDVLLGPQSLVLDDGATYRAVIADSDGGGTPPQAILLD